MRSCGMRRRSIIRRRNRSREAALRLAGESGRAASDGQEAGALHRAGCDRGRKPCLCKSAFAASLPAGQCPKGICVCPVGRAAADFDGMPRSLTFRAPKSCLRRKNAGKIQRAVKTCFAVFTIPLALIPAAEQRCFAAGEAGKTRGTNSVKPASIASKGRRSDRYFLGL